MSAAPVAPLRLAGEASTLARLDAQALITTALERGAGIDALERLFTLAKDLRAMHAREAWYAAMAAFQRTCPPIMKTATAKIQTARSSYAYSYAPLEEILSTVQPIMGPLGLSLSWRTRMEDRQVVAICRVAHELGHVEESGEVVMPVVQADEGRGANPAQRVAMATTYAKRYSLLAIIGMAPEDDDDTAGGPDDSPSLDDRAAVEPPPPRPSTDPATAEREGLMRALTTWFNERKLSSTARGQWLREKFGDVPIERVDLALLKDTVDATKRPLAP